MGYSITVREGFLRPASPRVDDFFDTLEYAMLTRGTFSRRKFGVGRVYVARTSDPHIDDAAEQSTHAKFIDDVVISIGKTDTRLGVSLSPSGIGLWVPVHQDNYLLDRE